MYKYRYVLGFTILILFLFFSSKSVYADSEYNFNLNTPLENKVITYTWDNTIYGFDFKMISPTDEEFSLSSEYLEYEDNQITITIPELEAGSWTVLFVGEEKPENLKNVVSDVLVEEMPNESSMNLSSEISEDIIEEAVSEEVIKDSEEEVEEDIVVIGDENTVDLKNIEENTEIEDLNLEEMTEVEVLETIDINLYLNKDYSTDRDNSIINKEEIKESFQINKQIS